MHPLQPSYDTLITLIRLACGHGAEPVQGPVDWNAVFSLAIFHKIGPMAMDGLEILRNRGMLLCEGPAIELKEKLISLVMVSTEKRNKTICTAIAQMAAFYREHGIRMMVLKGYTLALNWPIPNHRVAGDLDIWLFGRQKEADELLTKEKGIEVDHHHHHHTVFHWGKVMVENHYDFINVHQHLSHVSLEKTFKELGMDDGYRLEIDGETVYVASPKLGALFLLKHSMLHFVSYGFGFRQLLDWGFFAEKHGKELDWEWLLQVMDSQGMLPLFHVFNAILVEDFGFDESIFPPIDIDSATVERVRTEMYYPRFSGEQPQGPLLKRLSYKFRRWRAGLWKQKLCYRDSVWSAFWSGVWSHILKPSSI